MPRIILLMLLTLFLLVVSCGKNKEEKVLDAIELANIYLTQGQCNSAIETLLNVGMQATNARYIATLSSGYACKAGFSEPVFFGSDISKINSAKLIASLTTLSTSKMTSSSDASFLSLQTAIDTIIYSGGVVNPTSADRAVVFNTIDMGNLNTQAIYMVIAQLGKYFYYYGNADPVTGNKGGGLITNGNTNGNTNECLYTYAVGEITILLPTNPCSAPEAGHPDLTTGNGAVDSARMCKGVVLFNSLLDLLSSTALATTSSMGALTQVGSSTFTDAVKLICTTLNIGSICTVKSQADCEREFGGASGPAINLKKYFGNVFEPQFLGN